MKSNILYSLAILSLLSVGSYGQTGEQKKYVGQIDVDMHELAQRGDSLYVSMTVDLYGLSVANRESMDFTPVLSAGDRRLSLPAVSIKGNNEYRAYKRSLAVMSDKEREKYISNSIYGVYKAGQSERKRIEYRKVLVYENWMENSWLDMRQDISGCRDVARMVEMRRLADNVSVEKVILVESYEPTPYVAFVTPIKKGTTRWYEEVRANLDFKAGTSNIYPEYGENPMELAKIRQMIEGIKSDLNVTVANIEIVGYASPEGNSFNNRILSEKRAIELGKYLAQRYEFPKEVYSMYYGGHNWAGLKEIVELSEMADKDKILEIIRSEPESEREAKLKRLSRGETYKILREDIYPKLRVADCKVIYDVEMIGVEEARRIMQTRPQDLSLNDIFMIANSYDQYSPEFADVFETAVRMYPDDVTAIFNAAASALARKDLASAQKYLEKAGALADTPEYKNNYGVFYMLKGQYNDAQQYLRQALEGGMEVAAQNLEEVEKKRENVNILSMRNVK